MAFYNFIWTDRLIEKLAGRGISPEEFEDIVQHPFERGTSRSTGRPARFGYLADGRYIMAVFEWADEMTVVPVTAFEVAEPRE